MKLKKFMIICTLICFIVVLSAHMSEMVGSTMGDYPNKLFYIKDVDNELNLDGGTVHFITRDIGHHDTLPRAEPMVVEWSRDIRHRHINRRISVYHDINFEKEGVYTVWVSGARFPIQVISLEEIERIVQEHPDRNRG